MVQRPKAVIALAIVLLLAGLSVAAQVWEERQTAHFVISYTTSGPDAVSASYVRLVEESLETAYAQFVAAGFEVLDADILVDILYIADGSLGTEVLIEDEAGGWSPWIEIGSESVMREAIEGFYTSVTLEDLVRSTCAHEVFHAFQDSADLVGTGDTSEISWVEAHATAIQEFVVPAANDYLEPALEFLLAPDGVNFFHRNYDAGIYWVYILERFGIQAIHNVMRSSADYNGRHAIDHAYVPYDTTFFDTWVDFALALATNSVPDAEVLTTLVPEAEGSGWWTTNRATAQIPTLTYQGMWTGKALVIDTVNAGNKSEYEPYMADDTIGTPLRVAHSYGIDFLELENPDASPMIVEFTGDPETTFALGVATSIDGTWSADVLDGESYTVPAGTELIRLVVTRTEPGTGAYRFVVKPGG